LAGRSCCSHEELRDLLHSCTRHNRHIFTDHRRLLYSRSVNCVLAILGPGRPNRPCISRHQGRRER
jgi:hypothetical protein